MASPEALGPASISLGATTSAFMGFLPKFSDVRRSDPKDDGMTKDLLLGQIAAVAVSVGTGVIISSLTGSSIPALVSVLMCVILISCFQAARKVA